MIFAREELQPLFNLAEAFEANEGPYGWIRQTRNAAEHCFLGFWHDGVLCHLPPKNDSARIVSINRSALFVGRKCRAAFQYMFSYLNTCGFNPDYVTPMDARNDGP